MDSSTCEDCDLAVPNCKGCILYPGTKQPFCNECYEGYILDEKGNECVPCDNFVKNCGKCQKMVGGDVMCMSCLKGHEINLV